ncbi:MAG: transporter substrate-binding domain-containing protein [Deltaproteobacteria bacterium]|nr:transporter substrate-binding domain-containing protein [Deltaproteobacteria bacterium]
MRERVDCGLGKHWKALVVALALVAGGRAALGQDLGALRRTGVLRVGTAGDYAPFSLAKGDTITGFDAEVATRIARDLGVRVQWVRFRWPDLADDLSAGKFDLVASGVTVRPERALLGRYTRPYAVAGAVALVRREDSERLADRAALNRPGVHIAVNRGGHLERLAHRLFPNATIEPVTDNSELPDRVLGARVHAALTDTIEARGWLRPELSLIGPFSRDRKALLVRRAAPELAHWLDTWLRERERDGWLGQLRRQWLGDSMFFAAGADREAVLQDIDLRCRLMPLVAATKIAQGLPIEDRGQEARVLERAKATARQVGIEPEQVVRLFASLVRAAKIIQATSGTDPRALAPPLEQLRDAIAGIDEHLVHQLRAAARTVKPMEWHAGVREGVEADGLTAALKADIADALAKSRTLAGSPKPAKKQAPPAVDAPGPEPQLR